MKQITTYPNYYITECGKVWNNKKQKFLKPSLDNEYLSVCLSHNNKANKIRIHTLVAIYYLNHTPCNHNIVVDHIDNNKQNNHVSNLQLITQRENLSKDKTNKTSKFTGVSKDKASNKWRVSIYKNNKSINLGIFEDELKASEAYQIALNSK